jgi:hypothetical protein
MTQKGYAIQTSWFDQPNPSIVGERNSGDQSTGRRLTAKIKRLNRPD